MTWVMEILNIHLEEQPLTKYYMIKCLVLPKCDYYQRWLAPMGYTFFSEKRILVVLLKTKLFQINSSLKIYPSQKTKSILIFYR